MKFKKKEALHAILFFTFAVILSFGAGEIAIRIISGKVVIYNIEMLKYGLELKTRDPANEISHIHKANGSAHLMGVDVKLNSLGNRSRELTTPKPNGEKRIYVAGSSVTLGWGVEEKQVFSFVAEEELNKKDTTRFNFINAGIGNYSVTSATKLLYRQFDSVKPDMVIFHYFIGDIEPREVGKDSWLLQQTYLGSFFYNDILGMLFKNKYKSLVNYYNQLYHEESPPWKQTRSELLQLKNFLAEKNIPLLIMIVPDFHDLSKESPYQQLYVNIQGAFEGMGLQTLNTFPAFQTLYGGKESQIWVKPNDPHPNAEGHKVMADVLVDFFLKNNVLGAGI